MLTSLLALMAKELRQTFRDKRMVAMLLVAPVLQLIVLGFAVELDVRHVPVAVADEDRTPASRAFADALMAGDTFDRKLDVPTGRAALEAIVQGQVPVALVIPRGFTARQARGRPTAVQVLVDGGETNRAIVAQNAVNGYVMGQANRLAEQRLAELAAAQGVAPQVPRTTIEPRVFYNPTLNSRIYFVPGVAATLLLVITMITTSMGLAREKEMGTLEQVMVTPIRPEVLILGKTLPFGVMGLVVLGVVLGAGTWIFDVPLRGALWLVFLAGALYMLTTLGMGLLISTVARNQQQAFMGGMLFMMPAILLSGFMTPVDNMPDWMRPLSGLTPVRHFVEILRAVLLKDASFTDLSAQFAALAGLGIVIYATSAYFLRRSLA
jgi:ABC-2 type transport system permease protein